MAYFDEDKLDLPFFTKNYIKTKGADQTVLGKAISDLPYIIESSGYAKSHLSITGAMDVTCPCCGNSIGVFHPANDKFEYMINNFGHCPHFGENGEFPDDAIGFMMAIRFGVNTRSNAQAIMSEYLNADFRVENDNRKTADQWKRERAKAREKTRRNQQAVESNLKTGMDMPKEAFALWKSRGITENDIGKLRPTTKDNIGFISGVKAEKLSHDGGYYYLNGLVFSLGETEDGLRSYQIRRCDKDAKKLITKSDEKLAGSDKNAAAKNATRFYTIGPARLFNAEMLDYANGLEPIFITEGPLDAVNLEIAAYKESDKVPKGQVMAIQGCENTSYLEDEFKARGGNVGIFLALDDDVFGKDSAKKLAERLGKLENVRILPFPGYLGSKDMNDMWRKEGPEVSSRWIRTISGIGRHILDGRVSEKTGTRMLLKMKGMTASEFKDRYDDINESIRIERTRRADSPKKNEGRAAASSVVARNSKNGKGGHECR